MNDELMRRISDALDAPGGLEADEELRSLLAEDAEAAAYAQDVARIDGELRQMGPWDPDIDWEAFASRIEERLDRAFELEDIGDATAAPSFREPALEEPGASSEARASERLDGREVAMASAMQQRGEGGLDPRADRGAAAGSERPIEAAPTSLASSPAASAPGAPFARPREGGEVVSLAARRRRALFATVGGLAAAAAVALGITVGLTTLESGADLTAGMSERAEPQQAPAAPAEELVAPAEEAAEAAPGSGLDQALAELPAGESAEGWAAAEQARAEGVQPEASLGAAAAAGAHLDDADEEAEPRRMRRRTMRRSRGAARSPEPSPPQPSPPPMRSAGGAGSGALDPFRDEPSVPSHRQMASTLRAAEPAVRRCMGDRREVARVRVTVRGADGAISDVTVQEPFAGTPAESCIEAAVQRVRMPRASADVYQTGHAYRPAPIAGSGGSAAGRAVRSRARREAPAAPPAAMADEAFKSG